MKITRPLRTRCFFLPAILLVLTGFNKVSAQYCTPTSTYSSSTNIQKVELQDISYEHAWVSGDETYNDYTQAYKGQTTLNRGQSYIITITRGSYYLNMHYVAWIDYNNDGDFTDNGEKLNEITAPSNSLITTYDLPFTVPATSPVKSTRLRIRCVYNTTDPDPCMYYTYGETEDYTVAITDFERISTGITDGGAGEINFFNYDNDSDYDLIVQDEYSATDPVMFFRYATGTYSIFDYINGTIPEPENDNLSYNLCDLNNDNSLDLLLTYRYSGISGDSPRTLYYQKSAGLLNQVSTGIADLMLGSTATADLNNDGKQDVIICGEGADRLPYTYIYKNCGGSFELINDDLKGVNGRVLTADFDNDGDMDIFLSGNDRYGNTNAIIYRNDNNWNFTNVMADLNKVGWLQVSGAGDFNNDGLTDLFISDKVYRNKGKNIFTEVPVNCPEFYGCRGLNDMDNDGDQELVGQDNLGIVILEYNGTSFNLSQHLYTTSIDGNSYNTGDYNDDNKQDIIFNYYNNIYLFKNNTPAVNAAPAAPGSLKSSVGSAGYYTVSFSWEDGTDDHTPPAGLTYNLRVGTSSTGNEILSSMTSTTDHSLLKPGAGNVGYNNSWVLRDLVPGTYYWSVQTVDNSGVTSAFTTPRQFIIEPPFKNSTFDIIGTISGAGAGADIDGDSDMDLITFGDPELDGAPALYVNEQSSPYTYVSHKIRASYELTGIQDLNNDNLPDLIARHNRIIPVEKADSLVLFVNKGNFTFQLVGLDSATYNRQAIADFDNDGDNDILVHHFGYYLYRNDGSLHFTRQKLDLTGLLSKYANISAIDIDRDNDFDFLVSGEDIEYEGLNRTYLFENTGNLNFVLKQKFSPALGSTGFMPRSGIMVIIPPDIVWNDFNFDGYPDLMLTGDDDYNNTNNTIYLNDGAGNFTLTDLSPRPTDKFSTSWIDFNKDGLLDIIMPKMGLSVDNSIYLSGNNNSYTPFPNILDDRADAMYIDVLDVDNDFDKDIVLNYRVLSGVSYYTKTTILTNTFNFRNSPPSPPSVITAEIDSFTVHLGWSKGTDYLMGKEGFTYNIWVGTSPGAPDIISPLADMSSGFRYVEELGNAGTNTSRTIENLPLGKYYWGVQTIDNSLQGSAWSSMGTFEISALTAEFSNDVVCAGTETQFADNSVSTQPIDSWRWDFGDGNSSTLQNPSYTFPKAGMNSVKLIVSAGPGIDSIIKDVYVKPVPAASFTAPDVCAGSLTNFTNTTALNGTTISSWSWTFGDESSSDAQNPAAHGYLNPGSYPVTLSAAASNGCSDSFSDNVTVGTYPVAAVTADAPLTFCKGDSVTLSVEDNPEYTYLWKSDGVALTGGITNKYISRLSGIYTVTVVNPSGNCSSTSSPVVINSLEAPPSPLLTAADATEFCQGDSVTLSVAPLPDIKYYWRLNGNNIGISTENNIFTAKLPGEYIVAAANASGCIAFSNRINVTINPKPALTAVIISGNTTFCEGDEVTLRVPALTGLTYTWHNENGPIAEGNVYVAETTGSYRLEIKNSSECVTMTSPVNVNVKEAPVKPVLDDTNYTPGQCPGDNPVRLAAAMKDDRYSYLWYKDFMPLKSDTLSYLDLYEAGNYQLKAGLNGCISESEIFPVEFPEGLPKPLIYAQGPTLWYLACSDTTAEEYKWYFGGKLIEGADKYYFVANYKLGEYQVSIGNKQGCFVRSDIISIPPGYTGINDENLNDGILIFPNPGNGVFTLRIENQYSGEVIVRIRGLDGKDYGLHKYEKDRSYFSEQINAGNLSKGIYLVHISQNNMMSVKKIIIE